MPIVVFFVLEQINHSLGIADIITYIITFIIVASIRLGTALYIRNFLAGPEFRGILQAWLRGYGIFSLGILMLIALKQFNAPTWIQDVVDISLTLYLISVVLRRHPQQS